MFHLFQQSAHYNGSDYILPVQAQLKAWRKANRKMKWGISEDEFSAVDTTPALSEQDRADGFIGNLLSYGFGEDGSGHADAVLSGKLAWDYAEKYLHRKTWQCQYIDLKKSDYFRLRPRAPMRPKGFYFVKFKPGDGLLRYTVANFRKALSNGGDTGCGPEGIQMVAITHYPHVAKLMDERKIALMAFADYDVAPYGFNDFFDALQMFCSSGVLGLGIGNVDHDYPMFGIPVLRFF